MTEPKISNIAIDHIVIGKNRRAINPAWVATLAANIDEIGLISPIEVFEEIDGGAGYSLVTGAHRLAAVMQLGWKEVSAKVLTTDQLKSASTLKLHEISENLVRNNLSVLDRSFDIADWRDLYLATNETNKGGRPKLMPVEQWEEEQSAQFALSFSAAAQLMLDISRRSVFNHLKVASLGAILRERISLHSIANSMSELTALAAEPDKRRNQIVDLLTAAEPKADTVADAIAILDKVPAATKLERWQAFHSKFAALKEQEQARFFAANRDAIVAWLEASKA